MKRAVLFLIFVAVTWTLPAEAQRRRPDPGPQPKRVHGIVRDQKGTPIQGARVFARDLKSNVIRTATTDAQGLYSFYSLPPSVDYEVYADFSGTSSEKKFVSSLLNRPDNVLNFDLATSSAGPASTSSPGAARDDGPTFTTFDSVDLRASFSLPLGALAPIPVALLLHGYGEDRSVWESLSNQLLARGWAVMALDLRGHGGSKMRNGRPVQASADWRTSPHEFPLDLDPALDWLKSQPRLNSQKIAVIGVDVGGNLALLASGRFPEVRTVVAIDPKLNESVAMAGSVQDFTPGSTLMIARDASQNDELQTYVKASSRVMVVGKPIEPAGTRGWLAQKEVVDGIFQWLKETY